jgi:hypothetical protein
VKTCFQSLLSNATCLKAPGFLICEGKTWFQSLLSNATCTATPWVTRRLVILEKNRVNKYGELVMQSSRYRTQAQNLDDALEKMQAREVRSLHTH